MAVKTAANRRIGRNVPLAGMQADEILPAESGMRELSRVTDLAVTKALPASSSNWPRGTPGDSFVKAGDGDGDRGSTHASVGSFTSQHSISRGNEGDRSGPLATDRESITVGAGGVGRSRLGRRCGLTGSGEGNSARLRRHRSPRFGFGNRQPCQLPHDDARPGQGPPWLTRTIARPITITYEQQLSTDNRRRTG